MVAMNMPMEFTCQTTILFKVFTARNCGTLFIYIAAAMIIGVVFELLLSLRRSLIEEYTSQNEAEKFDLKTKVNLTLYYTSVVLLANFNMFFLMSYNFWILLALIFGNVIGYFVFGMNLKKKEFNSILI